MASSNTGLTVLVIGGGGREHAIVKKLSESPRVGKLIAMPGNAGIGALAECVPLKATDIEGMLLLARDKAVDYVVVTPDDPLALGAVDALLASGIPCFGPTAAAARIEGSKLFAKRLMQKYDIPTAAYAAFDNAKEALDYLKTASYPVVVKADGLALGKGVTVARDRAAAEQAVREALVESRFGKSGERILIEEFLEGPEVSVLAFTDGKTIVPLPSGMDHKTAHENNTGANTGGMGAIAPNPFYTEEIAAQCMERIFLPTVRAMASEGAVFRGCLYFGLMLTKQGPKVIEYNCRFGDPETQAVLPLVEGDLMELMLHVSSGTLSKEDVRVRPGACCCVVLASGGYPSGYKKGYPIAFGKADAAEDVTVYHAGTALDEDGGYITNGGRVLGVSATAATLEQAVARAYCAAGEISFNDMFYRRDIGAAALSRIKE